MDSQVTDRRARQGATIRSWREALGLEQAAIAEHFGVSRGMVSLWESGERGLRREQHYRLARFFGIDWEEYCADMELEPLESYEGLSLRDWWPWANAQKIARRTGRSPHISMPGDGHAQPQEADTSRPGPGGRRIARYSVAPAH